MWFNDSPRAIKCNFLISMQIYLLNVDKNALSTAEHRCNRIMKMGKGKSPSDNDQK